MKSPTIKVLLLLSITLNLLVVGGYALKRLRSVQAKASPYHTSTRWQSRYHQLHPLPIDSGATVFIGNSLVEYFTLEEYFPNHKIFNRGISGDHTEGLLYRLNDILDYHPGKVLLCIGINDLISGKRVDLTVRNYKEILTRINRIHPQPEIWCHSLPPVAKNFTYTRVSNLNDSINKFNQQIHHLSIEFQTHYLPLHDLLTKEGSLNPAYSYDGIHPNAAGYEQWAKKIKNTLTK